MGRTHGSAKERHRVCVIVLAINPEAATAHALRGETDPLVNCYCVQIVRANCKLDSREPIAPGSVKGRLEQWKANATVPRRRVKTNAQYADMRPGLPMRWKDIAPARNLRVDERNGRSNVIENQASIKGERFRGGRSFDKRQEPLLPCNDVEHGSKSFEMRLREGNNFEGH